ncbi:hypothetical protein AVEN_101849-1 [Araneus ventricosus]|uniref:Uncharacterized protein n=1 Tax=Araneus ventricosus TaxID=182803 RepID=A0A4Y2DBQ3_ARAVE|nr:hypothetical protein AVEN_240689-1 [Araneus ventricosus]GBM12975.1 hypothetical protein AVEN_101849-1 [Araneus ventricosus]
MAGKRVLQRFSLEANPMNPTWQQNEVSRKCKNCGLISTRNGELSRLFYVTSRPVGKAISTEELKRVNQSLFGVLSTVQAGELIDTECY